MKKQWTNLAIAGSMALSLLLAGCGTNGYQVNPNDPYNTGYSDPYGGGSYGNDYGSTTGGYDSGYGSGGYGNTTGGYNNGGYGNTTGGYNNGGYGNTTGGVNNGAVYTQPAQLTLGPLDKKKSGILLWKKLTVSGQVKNNTQQILSGEIQIAFTKNGKVVESQTEFVADLSPQQSHSFSLKSTKSCDDVQVSVIAQVAAPIGGGYNNGGYGGTTGGYNNGGYGNTTGGYNSGYGNTTGGYGSGTGYGY